MMMIDKTVPEIYFPMTNEIKEFIKRKEEYEKGRCYSYPLDPLEDEYITMITEDGTYIHTNKTDVIIYSLQRILEKVDAKVRSRRVKDCAGHILDFDNFKKGLHDGMIHKLRNRTGYGLATCKEALEFCDWDMDYAEQYLKVLFNHPVIMDECITISSKKNALVAVLSNITGEPHSFCWSILDKCDWNITAAQKKIEDIQNKKLKNDGNEIL